ncbi:hypothetical protein PGIGA_G00005730 [Pangasianodon gigas]|uniref:Uncharacterized protein n=1 Tax=Pangasianodon gigas TaxID=30993 RepID=A0ACC5W5T3_PANGG|nr:hypothetical protein [Pangasianodon gigas]
MSLIILLALVGAAVAAPSGKERIIGGSECVAHSQPWMVSLHYGYHFCGGVLINEQWVLSTAQCWYNPHSMQLILGDHDVRVFEGTEQLLKIQMKLTDAVQPISVPDGCPYEGMPCTISGWGSLYADELFMPFRLQCADVPVVSDQECEKSYPGLLTRRMLCAGHKEGGKDACSRDAGSPLVCYGKVHGLVSWGQGCGVPGYPGVYVKVCEFLYWIRDVMAANP